MSKISIIFVYLCLYIFIFSHMYKFISIYLSLFTYKI